MSNFVSHFFRWGLSKEKENPVKEKTRDDEEYKLLNKNHEEE